LYVDITDSKACWLWGVWRMLSVMAMHGGNGLYLSTIFSSYLFILFIDISSYQLIILTPS
jgi:hypothetical protein